MNKNSANLKNLFNPRSVAVIGASHHPEKIGHKIFKNILEGGFKGKVYPVNSQGGQILKRPVYRRIEDLPEPVDTACLVIPAEFVLDAVQQCGRKGVKFLIIVSAGFSEIGNIAEEKSIKMAAEEFGMRIIGPNVFGIYSASASLNATFSSSRIKPGNLAIISQSGALGIALIGKTKEMGLGLASIASVGNQCDLEMSDILEYLKDDQNTKIVLLYLEGIKDGKRLLSACQKLAALKPLIVIKAGHSARGAQAALSHTGSLAVEDKVFDDLARQSGMLRVQTISEALNLCCFLSGAFLPGKDNVLILTNGGGLGVMASDAAEKYNLPLYNDQNKLKQIFGALIPGFGCFKNPVDLSGQTTEQIYAEILKTALEQPEFGSLAVLACETAVLSANDFYRLRETKAKFSQKTVAFAFVGSQRQKSGLTVFDEAEPAIFTLAKIHSYARFKETMEEKQKQVSLPLAKIRQILKNNLAFADGRKLLEYLKIKTPAGSLNKNLAQALASAEEIGYPVVLKIVAKNIIHKTEAGGVMLNLGNAEELACAYKRITANCKKSANSEIEGLEVSKMIEEGIHTIVGARRDPVFGPLVIAGSGGIYVEVFKDIAFRRYPLSNEEITRMIRQTKVYDLLKGKTSPLVTIIQTLGSLIYQCPEINEIEINPLTVLSNGRGVIALDAKINTCL